MLVRLDPFRDLDPVFEDYRASRRARQAPMDAYRRGDHVVIHLDVPGVDPDAIELTVDTDALSIKAERHWPAEEHDEIMVQERAQGPLSRQVLLGAALDGGRL